MVVGRDKGVWNRDAVVPGLVPCCKTAAKRGVQDVEVDVVL
jgi:hypothetical protein